MINLNVNLNLNLNLNLLGYIVYLFAYHFPFSLNFSQYSLTWFWIFQRIVVVVTSFLYHVQLILFVKLTKSKVGFAINVFCCKICFACSFCLFVLTFDHTIEICFLSNFACCNCLFWLCFSCVSAMLSCLTLIDNCLEAWHCFFYISG